MPRGDRKLPDDKRTQLDRLHQRVKDDLDELLKAIGLKIAGRAVLRQLTQLSQLGTSETGSAFVFNRGIPKVSTTFRAGEKRRWLRC